MQRPPPPPAPALLEAAQQSLRAGRPAEARARLASVLQTAPAWAPALHLLALAFAAEGRPGDAVAAHRRAAAAEPRSPLLHVALGDALAGVGDGDGAEAAYRAALAVDPSCGPAARQLAGRLTGTGRPEDAVLLLEPLLSGRGAADQSLLHELAEALRAAGRAEDALVVRRRAAAAPTAGAVADHNLAALLGDLGRSSEALEAARRARRRGLDAPETYLVEARAHAALGAFSEAVEGFHQVLARRPLDLEAHRDLAQTLWMWTADVKRAVEPLEAALRRHPDAVPLLSIKATALAFAGAPMAAFDVLKGAAALRPADPGVRLRLAQAAVAADRPEEGLAEARAAEVLSPHDDAVVLGLVEALLAVGEAAEARARALGVLQRRPASQLAAAHLATAARLLGDPLYERLYDYDAMVRPLELDTPKGWGSLEAYLCDLEAALSRHHHARTHPFDQSLRQGSQIAHVLELDDAPIAAFRQAVAGPVGRYVAELGPGSDPLRAANRGGWRTVGAWSVRLAGGGGRHVNHIHSDGWISSAAYIALPPQVADKDRREGWITFGEPGLPTRPALGPGREVCPQRGLVVLFPSYMWHGTTPFHGEAPRLTIAFDLGAAPAGVAL